MFFNPDAAPRRSNLAKFLKSFLRVEKIGEFFQITQKMTT